MQAEGLRHVADTSLQLGDVGTQVVARDFTGDKKPDIVVGNKKGTFVFQHETKKVSKEAWEQAEPKPNL